MSSILIDGMSMLKTSAGHVSGLDGGLAYSFLRSLKARVEDVAKRYGKVDRVIVCWDGDPSARRADIPSYKSDRERSAASVGECRQMLIDILPSLGVWQSRHPDWEADDLLAFFATSPNQTVIVSGDQDLRQTVSLTNHLWQKDRTQKRGPKADPFITPENFFDRTGFRNVPEWLIAKAVMGDGSDKISGLQGIGKGTMQSYFMGMNVSESAKTRIRNFLSNSDGQYARITRTIVLPHPDFTPEGVATRKPEFSKEESLRLLLDYGFTSITDTFDKWWLPFSKIEDTGADVLTLP